MGCGSSTEDNARPAPVAAKRTGGYTPQKIEVPMAQGPDYSKLPPEFPPAPDKPTFDGGSEDEYKAFMRKKMKREQWENSALLYQMREKDGNADACKAVIERLKATLDEP